MHEHVRVYIPGLTEPTIKHIEPYNLSLWGIRYGMALPIPATDKLEDVWLVEFEENNLNQLVKQSPKMILPGKLDELVQYTIYPIKGKNVVTTIYPHEVSEEELNVFKRYAHDTARNVTVRICMSQYPTRIKQRSDGLVVFANKDHRDNIRRMLKSYAFHGMFIVTETQVFPESALWQEEP